MQKLTQLEWALRVERGAIGAWCALRGGTESDWRFKASRERSWHKSQLEASDEALRAAFPELAPDR